MGSRRIIGFTLGEHHDEDLAETALCMAIAVRGGRPEVASVILHTDQGSEGGFNWSSQHLDHGGMRWDPERSRHAWHLQVSGGSGQRIGHCDRRCAHPADQSLPVRFSVSSGG
ncbi:hypothetical protein [Tomitella fengzijianii]|uniref:hypothetical protein n=1 Tax=Tomitella fengzijianii TaxID=2597660 RepID=UPI00131D9D3D|nr:hypothetical protein [Tomitella fengzijianii]